MEAVFTPTNLPTYQLALWRFLKLYPKYATTRLLDELRRTEYSHLDEEGNIHFDYTGICLFSNFSNVDFALAYTSASLHTHALYEDKSTLEAIFRRRVLTHMNLHEEDYTVIFTSDAFSALRLVSSYPFKRLILAYDFNHESFTSIKLSAKSHGIKVFDLDLNCEESVKKKLNSAKMDNRHAYKGLFVYPSVSRVTGVRNSDHWIEEARSSGWCVLLDVSGDGCKTNLAGLSPDLVIGSFYKGFGMDPAGFGCLAIKKNMLVKPRKYSEPPNTLGMVRIVPRTMRFSESRDMKQSLMRVDNDADSHQGSPILFMHAYRYDTQPQLHGLDHIENYSELIKFRQESLLSWLRAALLSLKHSHKEDSNLVHIYSPPDARPSLAFSLFDYYGNHLEAKLVQKLANRSNISLGTGILQMPYESEVFCRKGSTADKYESFSVVCATVGFMTNFSDVFHLWEFIAKFLDPEYCKREILWYQTLNQETVIV